MHDLTRWYSRLALGLALGAGLLCTACPQGGAKNQAAAGSATARQDSAPHRLQAQAGAEAGKARADGGVVTPTGHAVCELTVAGGLTKETALQVEHGLIKLDGVSTVSADEKSGVVKVEYDLAKQSPQQLMGELKALGFKASLALDSPPPNLRVEKTK